MVMKGIRIQLVDKNPFLIEGSEEERPATKVIIGNIPLSCDNNEIEIALKKLGWKLDRKFAMNSQGTKREPSPSGRQVGVSFLLLLPPPHCPQSYESVYSREKYTTRSRKKR